MLFTRVFVLSVALFFLIGISCSEKEGTIGGDSTEKESVSKEGDETSTPDSTLADQYFVNATNLTKKALYDSANFYFEKAATRYERAVDPQDESKAWENYVKCYNRLGDNLRKISRYKTAIEKLKNAIEVGLDKLGTRHLVVAQSYHNLGIVYHINSEYDIALDYYQKALSIRRETLGESHKEIASSYNNIGVIYINKGNFDKALEIQKKTLSIRRAILGENHNSVAMSYNNLGVIYLEKGDYDNALNYYQKALSIRRHKETGEVGLSVAINYRNIGDAYDHKGDYDNALNYYQKALSIQLRKLDENHSDIATTYLNIGAAYYHKADYDNALDYYRKALSVYMLSLDTTHPLIANIHNNFGVLFKDKNDYDNALISYRKALAAYIQTFGENHPDVASTYHNIGVIYSYMGDYDNALNYYKKALSIDLQTLGTKHPDLSTIYLDFGKVFEKKDDLNQALSYIQKGIVALIKDFNDNDVYVNPDLENTILLSQLVKALHVKAKVLFKLGTEDSELKALEMSLATYELAIRLIDRTRISYKSENSKLLLSENVSKIYNDAIQTAILLQEVSHNDMYGEKAFLFAEKSKGGVLLEAFLEAEAKHFGGIPDSLLEKERRLRLDLVSYDQSLTNEQLKGETADNSKIALWQDKMFKLNQGYQELLERLENKYPDYYNLKYQAKAISVEEIREQLLDENTTLVEYVSGNDSIFIFVVTSGDLYIKSTPKYSSFQTLVEQFRKGITQNDYALYTQSAYKLYEILLKPVAEMLRGQNLIIVPDGILSIVPFEALLTMPVGDQAIQDYAKLPYLIDNYAINYAYSAMLLQETIARERKNASKEYAGFAPVFRNGLPASSRGADFLQKHLTASTRSVTDIPPGYLRYSEMEVTGVFDLFQSKSGFWRLFGTKSKVFLEDDATEANAKSAELADYRYVHFATHGFINEKEPRLSGLQLAENPNDSTLVEDGYLSLAEVYNLNLCAELVTLSACETGLGQLAKGEGIIGLTRGFLYAGASNVLVSLWKVNDQATPDFMVDFYSKILSGTTKTEALREAKRAMIGRHHPEYNKPHYWAPFILIGR